MEYYKTYIKSLEDENVKIQTEVKLDSAHRLPNYIGKCANLHGHTWKIVITVDAEVLDINEFAVDFVKVKEVMNKYDHTYLNNFIENPNAENLAYKFANEIKELGNQYMEGTASPIGNRFNYVTVKVYESEVSFAEVTI